MKIDDVVIDSEPPTEDGEVESYSDEDFWEALDLLETSKKTIIAILRSAELTAGRKLLLERHRDDIGVFLNYFVETEEK